VAPISAWEWAIPFVLASTVIVAMELFKWNRRRGSSRSSGRSQGQETPN
jgi:hypothetical protein